METREATQEINELLRLSSRTLNFEGPAGFRTVPVVCTARTGQTIRFTSPEMIGPQLLGLMNKVRNLLRANSDIDSVARAFSMFWLGFIAIHPFINGNGRTGKAYLEKKASELGFSLKNLHILDQILLLGDMNRDLSLLQIYFKSNLTLRINS